ncbi:hypothetical protein COY91_03195 [Candidatus Shapirobacteria bacterium CG_4_10_14_0_8_um_filter_39_15]|nr:MAG: hypothetical protein COY91_03195 [Candidatus Shapirobacteria bacterium CG_4_10_14_0_8_um_filter_39_15]PJE68056.1 MAG: hypothetical protein COU94_03825 [Candidatus Shapirobacteria bacterium CG10_big_fil_rev_8_21_14_0_10_38_8]
MTEEKRNDGFLLGLAIGGLIGTAVAFMLDKEDSEKLKKLITKKGKVLLDNLGDVAEEGQEKLEDTVTDVKENVVDKVEDIERSGKSSLRHFFIKAGKKLAK